MEYQKITNLLGSISDKVQKFITKKWVEVYDQSGDANDRYKPSKQIRFKTLMLQSDLCDYSDAYIVAKGTITVTDPNINAHGKKLAFKNNATFINCILKINNTLMDNTEPLDIVMLMYNLTEYSKNYSESSGRLWSSYRDEPNSRPEGNITFSIKDSKVFDYKSSITEKLESKNIEKENVDIVLLLKYLSNFWGTLDIPLIN